MFTTKSRRRVYAPTSNVQITKQSHKKECDINNILNQYKKTGIITHIQQQPPVYADLPESIDYQSALNLQIAADSAFGALPSVIRRYFDNDPALLLAALSNPEMRPKLEELGILNGPSSPRAPGNPANAEPAVDLSHEPTLP